MRRRYSTGRWASPRARLGPHVVPVIRAATVARQIAAAVRGHDLQAGMPIEHTAENQMGQRDRGFERLADDVAQVIGIQALAERRSEGMDEDDGAQLLGRRPERRKLGRAELELVDRGGNLDALEPELLHGIPQLLGGELRVLQGYGAQPDEPVGIARAGFRDVFVLRP